MGNKKFVTLLVSIGFFIPFVLRAAKPEITVAITTQHGKWEIARGEMTSFIISVKDSNDRPVKNILIKYEIGPEMMKPFTTDSSVATEGKLVAKSYTMYRPGFLRCVATITWKGQAIKKIQTVGYDPAAITPTVGEPVDFDAYWEGAKNELARVPLDKKMELLPNRGSATVDVYHVGIRNIGNTTLYGILAVPKKAGNYPAVLQVPGAGVRPYGPDLQLAEKGVIVFTIGIHGIPVNLDSTVYRDLGAGALNGYYYFNLHDRNRFYYKRVYLGCVRAIDFLFTVDQFDKQNLGVYGGSQGGALSIVTGALDKRVKSIVVLFPALSDLTGYLYDRAGGWPHVFANENFTTFYSKENVQALSYYDVVNFSKRLTVPGFYSWGYNDNICPPTSMYAAYNVIKAPKELRLFYDLGHWAHPTQKEGGVNWLVKQLQQSSLHP